MITQYYKNLPKKRMGSGALLLNERNQILIVRPSYKDHWSIPGGVVDENESPRNACTREVQEEIGITLKRLIFLCVDYMPYVRGRGESLEFIFYGGKLSKDQVEEIKLDGHEIIEYKFVKINDALPLLSKNLGMRLLKCMNALGDKTGVYLEGSR